jgi:G3E family GTPase
MHLLLFSGFLGSGKTTFIIPLAKAVAQTGRRVAIIVNEIGEIGIDNQLMHQLDLNVWELVAGCICCTLSGDLIETLHKLDSDYKPELVIVEASGAADPRSILGALPYYRGQPMSSVRIVSVLDPLRLKVLMEVLTPLVTSQIRYADLVLISKTDIAAPDEVEFARQTACEINPSARIVNAGMQGYLEPELISELLPWLN